MTDLATLTAILYAARLQRRVPETDAEKLGTIAACLTDAKLIVSAVNEDAIFSPPDHPLPSPGIIGRKADAMGTRRRG